ncbi:MAG: tetratricopeptide repeat protein [Alphaproteobacteria bacterium]|nr:tetratricopeptide repeat protein [Alphaproteobacteria bacterium]
MTGDAKTGADPAVLSQGLAAGVALQRAGRFGEAERTYQGLLVQFPSNADVLQLLGLALKAQGKHADAEARLRQSLSANDAQPHVWSNLGNLLNDLGRFEEAAEAYVNALRHNARFVDALVGQGGALTSLGKLDEAAAAYERARRLQPRQAAGAIGLATIATRRHDLDAAEHLLREALLVEPKNPAALYNLGMTYAKIGDGEAARPLIALAVASRPGRADMLTGLGYALQISGRTTDAIAHYRQAIALNPMYLAAYENLARLLWQIGKQQEYIADLDAAIVRHPDRPELHISRANLLGLAKRHEEALGAFARAHALNAESPVPIDGMARMTMELGEIARALDWHDKAVSRASQLTWVRTSRAHTRLRVGDAKQAIEDLEVVLAAEPANQLALADLSLALRALGDPRENWLADFDRFAVVIEVPAPRGYSDMAAFNADLSLLLDNLHQLQSEPIDQTLRNGTQTLGALFGRKIDLVTRLRERFDEVVRDYVAALPEDTGHPFLRRKSNDLVYRGSWSARLKSAGYHVTHIHPEGWISSAYYASLPPAVATSTDRQGWFTLGDPPFDVPWTDRVRRFVQPKEGALVLFPSYFYHGTIPFAGDQTRTTIAFDVAPRGGQ